MWPIVFDNATPIIGCDEFGSSYAITTLSPLDATLTREGLLPNTIGTGEWKVFPSSIECSKNIPAPDSGSAKYAMWTYPLDGSAAIAGAGRPQPFTLLSDESAMTGSVHDPDLDLRADFRIPLESGRTSHHTAYLVSPASAILNDAGQDKGDGDSMLPGYSFGCGGAPLKTISPQLIVVGDVQAAIVVAAQRMNTGLSRISLAKTRRLRGCWLRAFRFQRELLATRSWHEGKTALFKC
jgi:hypothetical protein